MNEQRRLPPPDPASMLAPQNLAPQNLAPQSLAPPRKRAARRGRKLPGALALFTEGSASRALALADADTAPGQRALALPPPQAQQRRQTFRPGVFGVLDIGTSKVTCLIGRGEPDGSLRVMGCGWQRSRGVRLGGITDFKEAERAIRAAVGQAEEAADHHLRSVTVSLTCGAPESRLFDVRLALGGRIVADADIRRIVSEGRQRASSDRSASERRDVVHALPQRFAVDEVEGVEDPRGHHCDHLSARLHVIDAGAMALRNLTSVIGRCDLGITELVAAPFASGLSVLVDDERELGATVIDMGGGTTQIAVFAENQLLHTSQLPVGGLHVTRDIARGLSTPLDRAEWLKAVQGHAELTSEDDGHMLQVQQIGEGEHRFARIPRSRLVSVIRPRLEETFELVRERLDQAALSTPGLGPGLSNATGGRVVLTGGASQLEGVQRLAAHVLNRRVRLGAPTGLRGLPPDASGPGFATAAGLLAWAAGAGRTLHDIDFNEPRPAGLIRRLVEFLSKRV